MTHDGHTVGGEVYVQFQPVGTGRKPTLERGHGVLRSERAAATVRKHTWTERAPKKGTNDDSTGRLTTRL